MLTHSPLLRPLLLSPLPHTTPAPLLYTRPHSHSPHAAGAGIGIQPIGLTVLKHLGLLDTILAKGARLDRLHGTTTRGRTVLDLHYADFDDRLHGLGLSRGVLFHELFEACKAEPNITVEVGQRVGGAEVRGTVTESSSDGSYLVSADGARHGPYDLLICADGRSSTLRRGLSSLGKGGVWSYESPYPYGCLWAILPDVDEVFTKERTLRQHVSAGSAQRMLGIMPTGRQLLETTP